MEGCVGGCPLFFLKRICCPELWGPRCNSAPVPNPQHHRPLPQAPAAAECGSPGLEAPQCLGAGCRLPELYPHLDLGPYLLVHTVRNPPPPTQLTLALCGGGRGGGS